MSRNRGGSRTHNGARAVPASQRLNHQGRAGAFSVAPSEGSLCEPGRLALRKLLKTSYVGQNVQTIVPPLHFVEEREISRLHRSPIALIQLQWGQGVGV